MQTKAPQNEVTIIDLIPIGKDNAISRESLTELCVCNHLINPNMSDKDRAMRRLLEKARRDCTILNISDGNGYYRASKDDLSDLRKYIRQEDNRARAAFRNHSLARKLYEDYKSERIQE